MLQGRNPCDAMFTMEKILSTKSTKGTKKQSEELCYETLGIFRAFRAFRGHYVTAVCHYAVPWRRR